MSFTDLSYFIGQGSLYAAKRVKNGDQVGGYISLGDASSFVIDPKQTFENISESQSGYGLTAAHVATETMLNVKLTLIQPSNENWAKAMWGTASGTVTGATVTGEAVVVYPGPSVVPMAHPGVSNVTLSAGAVDTDYTVDSANGVINILEGSTTFTDAAGTAATVSYDFDDYTGSVEAFTIAQPCFRLLYVCKNTANQGLSGSNIIAQPTRVECYQWEPDMAGTIELLAKKHTTFELNGMLTQDQTLPTPTVDSPVSQFLKITRA